MICIECQWVIRICVMPHHQSKTNGVKELVEKHDILLSMGLGTACGLTWFFMAFQMSTSNRKIIPKKSQPIFPVLHPIQNKLEGQPFHQVVRTQEIKGSCRNMPVWSMAKWRNANRTLDPKYSEWKKKSLEKSKCHELNVEKSWPFYMFVAKFGCSCWISVGRRPLTSAGSATAWPSAAPWSIAPPSSGASCGLPRHVPWAKPRLVTCVLVVAGWFTHNWQLYIIVY